VIVSPEEEHLELVIRLAFATTNNEAEYDEAIIAGMGVALELGV
jgi:ribonuclease HI